jgi:hypothetical protein
MDNNIPAYVTGGYTNQWDNGYPSGGNHWSNYNGKDLFSDPEQNHLGSDGIGDMSCTIDSYNVDDYPLMGMFSDFNVTSEFSVQTISNSTISNSMAQQLASMFLKKTAQLAFAEYAFQQL